MKSKRTFWRRWVPVRVVEDVLDVGDRTKAFIYIYLQIVAAHNIIVSSKYSTCICL